MKGCADVLTGGCGLFMTGNTNRANGKTVRLSCEGISTHR